MQLYLTYLFFILIFLVILIQIILKTVYGFWYYQPVIHSYDFFRLFHIYIHPNQGMIICDDLPSIKNRFLQTNPEKLQTFMMDSIPLREKNYFMQLIQYHYLRRQDGNVYEPQKKNIYPYFVGHNYPCYISFYYEPSLYMDSTSTMKTNIIKDFIPIGTITSRPLTIYFNKNPVEKLETYYIEFLCVHNANRKQGIAPQLIQSHEYYQRHNNHKIKTSLFKHEDTVLQGILPLTVYTTYGFPITKWMLHKPDAILPPYKLLEITTQTMPYLMDFMEKQRNNYNVFIVSTISNIIELIKTQNIFVYVLMDLNRGQQIVSAYFYRNSCVRIETGQNPVLTLIGSLYDINDNENNGNNIHDGENEEGNKFIEGFKNSFYKIAKKKQFGFCGIENISNNNKIIEYLIKKTEPTIKSQTAYFFYNYIYSTVSSENMFVLC